MEDNDKEKRIPLHCRRDFLNKEYFNSDASITTMVSVKTGGGSYRSIDMEVMCRIRDCNHLIDLDFYTPKDDLTFRNNIYKIQTLIDNLQEFKEAYKEGYKVYLEELKKLEEETKEKLNGKQSTPNQTITTFP